MLAFFCVLTSGNFMVETNKISHSPKGLEI